MFKLYYVPRAALRVRAVVACRSREKLSSTPVMGGLLLL
jgi:hypothetical protein